MLVGTREHNVSRDLEGPIRIAVGVLRRSNRFWIQQRRESAHLAGRWEFPGGKVEVGETPTEGLLRELSEEVGIELERKSLRLLWIRDYSYADRSLRLFFFLVELGAETPAGGGHWISLREIGEYSFPLANLPILEWLKRKYEV